MEDSELKRLLDNNQAWAARVRATDPEFFSRLAHLQTPEYLWIGCSDSRVPANQIVGLLPGEVFVHRNVANVVSHTDLNCLSVVQFAVEYLKVRHVLVVGHHGCGGVGAAFRGEHLGLIDNWLRYLHDLRDTHRALLDRVPEARREDVFCELNVVEQVVNLARSTVIENAWARGQEVTLHGWVYSLGDGLLRDLGMTVRSLADLRDTYRGAIAKLGA